MVRGHMEWNNKKTNGTEGGAGEGRTGEEVMEEALGRDRDV